MPLHPPSSDLSPSHLTNLILISYLSPEGRGYPDISAQGLYFAFFWNDTLSTISGTSASTPLTASIISLVNDARIAEGKSSLGWLNPWIYSKAHKAFKDVVGGETASCGTDGFPVTKGWDPSTGFGTPVSFPAFLFCISSYLVVLMSRLLIFALIDLPGVGQARAGEVKLRGGVDELSF